MNTFRNPVFRSIVHCPSEERQQQQRGVFTQQVKYFHVIFIWISTFPFSTFMNSQQCPIVLEDKLIEVRAHIMGINTRKIMFHSTCVMDIDMHIYFNSIRLFTRSHTRSQVSWQAYQLATVLIYFRFYVHIINHKRRWAIIRRISMCWRYTLKDRTHL